MIFILKFQWRCLYSLVACKVMTPIQVNTNLKKIVMPVLKETFCQNTGLGTCNAFPIQ